MIDGHRLRHPLFQLINSCVMARMSRQEFCRASTARYLLHPFPECNRLTRVIPSICGQKNPDIVCLGFMFAAKRKQHADLRSCTERRHGYLTKRRILATHPDCRTDDLKPDIHCLPLTHAFRAMPS